MDIAKQLVDQRVRRIVEENPGLALFTKDEGRNLSLAFLLLSVASYWDADVADILGNITEGGGDGGIDAAFLMPGEGILDVTLFQAKYIRDLDKDAQFPANAVEKAVATVRSVFDPGAAMALNERSRPIVDQIRAYIADGYVPYVRFVLANNGEKWNQDGQNKIDNEFMGQTQVSFQHFNHEDILGVIDRLATIDAKIRFSGKAVGEQLMYKPAVIGRVAVSEIDELMGEYKDALLERNIRKYLGSHNAVNKDIRQTLLEDSGNFFFYNNGITMVCRKLLYNELQKEDWTVQAEGLQIINGGQTCHTIHETMAAYPERDYSSAYVLVRMYAVGDDELVAAGITKATNTQSPIDLRDLHANEAEQRLLEISAKELGFTYKRKRDAVLNTNAETITPTVAAEAVYTVWEEKPHLLGRKRHELFGPLHYDAIFRHLNAAQMIIAVLLYRYCDSARRRVSGDPDIDAQRAFSQYTLATMMGRRLLAECGLTKEALTHREFAEVKARFESMKDVHHQEAEKQLVWLLKKEFSSQTEDGRLSAVDGRRLAAIFRRFDFIEKALALGNPRI